MVEFLSFVRVYCEYGNSNVMFLLFVHLNDLDEQNILERRILKQAKISIKCIWYTRVYDEWIYWMIWWLKRIPNNLATKQTVI